MSHQISTNEPPYIHHWASGSPPWSCHHISNRQLCFFSWLPISGFPDITKTKVFFAIWLDANTNHVFTIGSPPDLQLATLFLFLTAANSGAGFPDITKTKVFFATWLDANTNCLTNLDLYPVIKETYTNVCLQKGKV